jgi:hypothetical protein
MADDDRADARDDQVAQWLEVEPLDELTRRRLVSTALREGAAAPPAPAPARSSHAWQWLSAAAVIVVVLVVGLALLTADGGNNEEQASRTAGKQLAPEGAAATRDVGNFGDLDDPANLAALRAALGTTTAAPASSTPRAASDAAGSQFGATSKASPPADTEQLRLCGVVAPDGGRVVAQGSGTIDGRRATVVLLEEADGTRTVEAVLEEPCEVRQLP